MSILKFSRCLLNDIIRKFLSSVTPSKNQNPGSQKKCTGLSSQTCTVKNNSPMFTN